MVGHPVGGGGGPTITDFNPNGTPANPAGTPFNPAGTPFVNVVYQPLPLPATPFQGQTGYNMGGCMGCHGNAQQGGADFSFILRGGPVAAPDAAPGGNGGFGGTLVHAGGGVGAAAPAGKSAVGAKIIQKYLLHP